MFIGIPLLIIAAIVIYGMGSSSRQDEIDELNDKIADLEGRLEDQFGEDWEDITDDSDNVAY